MGACRLQLTLNAINKSRSTIHYLAATRVVEERGMFIAGNVMCVVGLLIYKHNSAIFFVPTCNNFL
jgi:hypothetical protein